MTGNRKEAEQWLLIHIKKITLSEENVDIYRKFFASMNDKQFDQWVDDLESGKKFLTVEMPNFGEEDLVVGRNLAIAEEIGLEFFQELWIEGKGDVPTHLTPIKYMIIDMPYRRASQLLTKKISVPKNNKVIDSLTGQPTGESKGAKISFPELQVLTSMGLENSTIELIKYRGGDNRGRAALTGMVSKFGEVRLAALAPYASGVESTILVKTFLTSCHLRNSL